jgi:hypothetical protein
MEEAYFNFFTLRFRNSDYTYIPGKAGKESTEMDLVDMLDLINNVKDLVVDSGWVVLAYIAWKNRKKGLLWLTSLRQREIYT